MKPDRKYDVVVSGYLCVDLAPEFGAGSGPDTVAHLRPGSLTEVKGITVSLGGAVANTGMAFDIFGQRVLLMALVGKDILGEVAIRTLKEKGLAEGIQTTERSNTAYSIVLAPPGVDRLFLESPGCNMLFASSDVDYRKAAQSRLFHFGYPPLMKEFYSNGGTELAWMFSKVRDLGVMTSLDMTLPDPESASGKIDWKGVLTRVLQTVDIFTPSVEEIVFMMRPEIYAKVSRDLGGRELVDALPENTIPEIGREIIELGVKVAFIKAGRRGAWLFTGKAGDLNDVPGIGLSAERWNNQTLKVPAMAADAKRVKNANGAGDAAVAGFLTALLRGENPDTAMKYAMCAGRNNLYGMNATDGLTDWAAMTREVR